jgi:hypothetical protein
VIGAALEQKHSRKKNKRRNNSCNEGKVKKNTFKIPQNTRAS